MGSKFWINKTTKQAVANFRWVVSKEQLHRTTIQFGEFIYDAIRFLTMY